MSVKTRTQVLDDLVEILQPDDLRWLGEQLLRLSDDERQSESDLWDDDNDDPLPESATLDEAIQLYLDDKCSLGRAAELAGLTRWDLQKSLHERGTPVEIYGDRTAEEIDELAEELKREGLLYSGGPS